MTLQYSGPISASDINIELGRSGSATMSIDCSTVRNLAGVPSGTIAYSNFYGKSSIVTGSQTYTSPGTYTWYAPSGVTSVSVVVIGSGGNGAFCNCGYPYSGGAGGSGGALGYGNNISVTPGTGYTVKVGTHGYGGGPYGAGASYFGSVCWLFASGGYSPTPPNSWVAQAAGYAGGSYRTSGYSGGIGGNSCCCLAGGGGGGAGGYSGNGGAGGGYGTNGTSGGGGSGGGGSSYPFTQYGGGGGGGVWVYGQGSSGSGGGSGNLGGGGGSGGSGGGVGTIPCYAGYGGFVGGGGGGSKSQVNGGSYSTIGIGYDGAVRIVWPGNTRQFPATNVGSP